MGEESWELTGGWIDIVPRIMPKKQISSSMLWWIIVALFILCDVFIFNANHFITRWGDGQISMSDSGAGYRNLHYNGEVFSATGEGRGGIFFDNLDMRVVTVYIDALFTDTIKEEFFIQYGDETRSRWSTDWFTVYKGAEESKYAVLQTRGNVSYIRVFCRDIDSKILINDIVLNKTVPLRINPVRIFIYSFVLFGIVVIKQNKYYALPVNKGSVKQKMFTAVVVAAFVLFMFWLTVLATPFSGEVSLLKNLSNVNKDQYNAFMVDALIEGQPYFIDRPIEELLALENPYDPVARNNADLNEQTDYHFDTVLYGGKYYSYFGIVQVLVLSLPFKLLTGNYIPTPIAVLIFSSLAGIFLMLLWRRLVMQYMKKMPFVMYVLGLPAVAMCSMLPYSPTRAAFYDVANTSGLFFGALGLWLILGSASGEKIKKIQLFFGCLCMALAVGCRPTHVFFSLLVPVMLFDKIRAAFRDRKQLLITLACAATPYILVASALMWYNYIRFGSITEFGASYQLTMFDCTTAGILNPVNKVAQAVTGAISYLVPSFDVKTSFPFIFINRIDFALTYKGIMYSEPVMGLLGFPVVWSLFGIVSVKKITSNNGSHFAFWLPAAKLSIGTIIMIIVSGPFGGINRRYSVDFSWLFVFSGLICSYYLYEYISDSQMIIGRSHVKDETGAICKTSISISGIVLKLICAGIILSIIIVFFLVFGSAGGNRVMSYNPHIVYHIQRFFGFNTW